MGSGVHQYLEGNMLASPVKVRISHIAHHESLGNDTSSEYSRTSLKSFSDHDYPKQKRCEVQHPPLPHMSCGDKVPGFIFSDMFIQISTRLPSQYVYGFGETEHAHFRHEMDWHTWGMFARDQSPGVSSFFYHLHYNVQLKRSGFLLLNSNGMEVKLQPTPALTYRTIGGILDFYVVLGPTPEQVVQEYTALIGRPVMPPYWSLGFQLCRYGYGNDTEISDLYDAMRAAKIPYDVQYADIDYMERQLDFTIGPEFSKLPALVDKMKLDGMRFIIILVISFKHLPALNIHWILFLTHLVSILISNPSALQSATGERGIIIPRSTYPSSGKWAGHWLGDNFSRWDQLLKSIIGESNYTLLICFMMGTDICGFNEHTNYQMCARWMQLGAFYPFARNHNGIGYVVSFAMHYPNLYPFLIYCETVFPVALSHLIIYCVAFRFTDDRTTWDIDRQFLWGPALLISPVLDEVSTYVKANKDIGVRGNYSVLQAELEHINLHLRGGYIIPWQLPDLNTNASRKQPMGLTVALDDNGAAQGLLYWDDGKTIDAYENGLYLLHTFNVSQNALDISLAHEGYFDPNNLKFSEIKILGLSSKPVNVMVFQNGAPISSSHNETYDSSTQLLHIQGLQLALGQKYTLKWGQPTEDTEKFNCYPYPEPTQSTCEERGCFWQVVSTPGVPHCFYPKNYGYTASNIQHSAEGVTADLQRNTIYPNPYGSQSPAVDQLRLVVTYHYNNMLQFKIYDPNHKRYEVPVPLFTPSSSQSTEASRLYQVDIVNNPFGLQIRRKSTGTIIWNSQVPGFTFSDMFIQIATRLPSQYVYGFGETEHTQFRRDMNWQTWGMFTKDQPPGYKLNSYGFHPFYMGLENDGNAHGVLLLNSNAMDVTFQPTPALTYRTIGGILDFYMVLGPKPEEVVQEYTALIGRPVMPPYWALGFQLCRYGYKNTSEVAEVYDAMRAARIPYDVQYTDIDYMERKLDFTLGKNFSDLPAFVDRIKSEGSRYIIILDPAISGNETEPYNTFTSGVQEDVFIKWINSSDIAWAKVWPDYPNVTVDENASLELYRAYVAFPDFLRSSTSQWWQRELVDYHANVLKYDGLWTDMNEPSNFIDGAVGGCRDQGLNKPPYMPALVLRERGLDLVTLCMDTEQHLSDGTPVRHYDVHNLYGWSQAESTYYGMRNATKERGIIITRSTYPSSGRWVGHWLGDNYARWDQLTKSVIGIMEFSLFGISYTGADICGFFNDTTYEMCARWMELGAFYTFSRNHNVMGTRRQDPVSFDERFVNISRDVLSIRYRLLPYLYTLMHNAHVNGDTVARPLLHEFVGDKTTWDIYKQFLWGPAFLISPVLDQGAVTVHAYIPDARWYDYHTGKYIGVRRQFQDLGAPLEHINLHIRGGYIIPWQEPDITTNASRKNPLGLTVALDDNGNSRGELYWDDGITIGKCRARQERPQIWGLQWYLMLRTVPITNSSGYALR
uniref:P-type domain-containing protein n=1 Tax=Podarcis muralis TaxID=64176 RepID=A0A670ID22_PODMU